MKPGDRIRLNAPVMGEQLVKFLGIHGIAREAYVRIEGGRAILYLVNRDTDQPQNGSIFASFPIPLLPDEV